MHTHHSLALRAPAIFGIALAIGTANEASSKSTDGPCQTATAEHLQSLGVDSRDIKEINMVRIIGLPELGNTIEFQGWANLESCQGSVVVKLTPLCRPKEAYSRGNCKITNIRQF